MIVIFLLLFVRFSNLVLNIPSLNLSVMVLHVLYCAFVPILSSVFLLQSRQEALEIPTWKKAMLEALSALIENDMWQLVSFPLGKKRTGCNLQVGLCSKIKGRWRNWAL